MTASQSLSERVPTLLRPAILLLISLYHFLMTILSTIFVDLSPFSLLNIRALRLKSFARLWKHNGAAMSAEMPGPIFFLLSRCTGVVLDIGPGSGELLSHFDPRIIRVVYGAEPAEDLHPALRENARKSGLEGKYKALICGAQPESLIPALHKSGVLDISGKKGLAEDGIFDEICCVRVLCGVPHPELTIKNLYSLLKPGGRMVVCEHVVSPWRTEGSVLARFMQLVYTLMGWPFLMGGCELQRHTERFLRDAGEWDRFDLEYLGAKDAIPFVVGELIKKKGELEKSFAEVVKE